MPKRKALEPDPEWDKLSQREKFIRTARELGCDESGEEYRHALGMILRPRKPGEPAPKIAKQPAPKGSRRRARKMTTDN